MRTALGRQTRVTAGYGTTALRSWVRLRSEDKPSSPSETKKSGDGSDAADSLPGIDLAQRMVHPSREFPATWSQDEPLASNDPRVHWREHYSLKDSRPYYENISTGTVTHDIPEGFVTRFPHMYRKGGFNVDEKGAVRRAAESKPSPVQGNPADGVMEGAAASAGTAGPNKQLTLKQKLAAFGGGGLLLYLMIHTLCMGIIFCCLYVLRIDLIAMARSYGFNVKQSKQDEKAMHDPNHRPLFFKTFFISIVLNKMLAPAQMLLTLFLAPVLVHRLEPVAVVVFPKVQRWASVLFKRTKENIKDKLD